MLATPVAIYYATAVPPQLPMLVGHAQLQQPADLLPVAGSQLGPVIEQAMGSPAGQHLGDWLEAIPHRASHRRNLGWQGQGYMFQRGLRF